MSIQELQERLIPVPPNFPMAWSEDLQPELFWTLDNMHFPEPTKPLTGSMFCEGTAHGFAYACEHLQAPLQALLFKRINTYIYNAVVPVLLPQEEMTERLKRYDEKITDAWMNIQQLWEGYQISVPKTSTRLRKSNC